MTQVTEVKRKWREAARLIDDARIPWDKIRDLSGQASPANRSRLTIPGPPRGRGGTSAWPGVPGRRITELLKASHQTVMSRPMYAKNLVF